MQKGRNQKQEFRKLFEYFLSKIPWEEIEADKKQELYFSGVEWYAKNFTNEKKKLLHQNEIELMLKMNENQYFTAAELAGAAGIPIAKTSARLRNLINRAYVYTVIDKDKTRIYFLTSYGKKRLEELLTGKIL